MKPFTEELRYEYPLTEDSWVVDVGAYHGNFSREIGRRYNCNVIGFEPVREFWKKAIKDQNGKTEILNVGLASNLRLSQFKIKGDSTGEHAESDHVEIVTLVPVSVLWGMAMVSTFDLFKINIEGAEYEVIERILRLGMHKAMKNIQIQFHAFVDDYYTRRAKILDELEETHVCTYQYPFVWENWQRK